MDTNAVDWNTPESQVAHWGIEKQRSEDLAADGFVAEDMAHGSAGPYLSSTTNVSIRVGRPKSPPELPSVPSQ